jgi:hypothetical protein
MCIKRFGVQSLREYQQTALPGGMAEQVGGVMKCQAKTEETTGRL